MNMTPYEYDEDGNEVGQHCGHDLKWECPSTPMSMVRMTTMDLFIHTIWAHFVPLKFSAYKSMRKKKGEKMIIILLDIFCSSFVFQVERGAQTVRYRERARVREREREREMGERNSILPGMHTAMSPLCWLGWRQVTNQ